MRTCGFLIAIIIWTTPSFGANELPVDAAQESALLKVVGEDFQIKRTPHFLVVHDSDPAIVNSFVSRVEQTYNAIYRFCEINKIETRRPSRRLEVIFFAQRTEFDRYARTIRFPVEGAYGVYYEPTNRSAFFNASTDPQMQQIHADLAGARASLEKISASLRNVRDERAQITVRYSDGRTVTLSRPQAQRELEKSRRQLTALDAQRVAYSERINRTVIQHEVAHQVFFNSGVHVRGASNPKWLVEGLACLFETPPDGSGTGSGIFAINQLRLHDFRSTVADDRPSESRLTAQDFIDAIKAGRFIAPRTLIDDSDVFNERGERGSAHYAMTWALLHYLQRERPAQLAACIKELSTRPAGTVPKPKQELAVFTKHFGPLDTAFLNRWGTYILKVPVRSLNPG